MSYTLYSPIKVNSTSSISCVRVCSPHRRSDVLPVRQQLPARAAAVELPFRFKNYSRGSGLHTTRNLIQTPLPIIPLRSRSTRHCLSQQIQEPPSWRFSSGSMSVNRCMGRPTSFAGIVQLLLRGIVESATCVHVPGANACHVTLFGLYRGIKHAATQKTDDDDDGSMREGEG